MTTRLLGALGAANALASHIEGFARDDGPLKLVYRDLHSGPIAPEQNYTSIRLYDSAGKPATAAVMIERPQNAFAGDDRVATVTFSGSGTAPGAGADYARATAMVLGFAVEVADQLNRWAASGQLPRLRLKEAPSGVVVDLGDQYMWTYVLPDADDEEGGTHVIRVLFDDELEHREMEALVERYGATSCQCIPPTNRKASS